MSNVFKKLHNDQDIDLRLIISGAHLSKNYGHTIQYIEQDGLNILLKIETLIDSDSQSSRIKTASILLQNVIDITVMFKPDLIIYAGDRENELIGAMLGMYLRIPTAHFFSGDHVKDGYIDNPVRHATSKLSSLHFVMTASHKQRLVKMGERSDRIFITGNPGLDKFVYEKQMDIKKIYKLLGLESTFAKRFALVIYHPDSDEHENYHSHFENILNALKKQNINAFVSYPNTDPGNKKIIDVIHHYINEDSFYFYKNLERNLFINIFRNAQFIIGNSSAGILEAASIPIPAINVGIRQTGRKSQENVIFIDNDIDAISDGIEYVTSEQFLNKIGTIRNIYGNGESSNKIVNILKQINYNDFLLKKEDPLDVY